MSDKNIFYQRISGIVTLVLQDDFGHRGPLFAREKFDGDNVTIESAVKVKQT